MPVATRRPASSHKPKLLDSLWQGPSDPGPHGGITYSMLCRWLVCRERFRLTYIEGLQPEPHFSHGLEYGSMWHVCEEEYARNPRDDNWIRALLQYCKGLASKYKEQSAEIQKWYNVCKLQFPIYIEYWRKHPDVKKRQPVYQEQVFDVPYTLPSGRVVRLRGKWDSVDLIGKGLYLQENKSKGDIDSERLVRQLPFDLQTNIYLTALTEAKKLAKNPPYKDAVKYKAALDTTPVAGVRYNVIRRPLSGQAFNIKQKKGRGKAKTGAETTEEFYKRLEKLIKENAGEFFFRYKMDVSPDELKRFQVYTLNPLLEQLCIWWDYIRAGVIWGDMNIHHFMMPYGVYSPLLEGRSTDLDEYINTGSDRGLTRIGTLFPELQG